MKNIHRHLILATLVAAVAATAIAAAGFDRLKDHVKIGQGNASDKVFEFDIGAGENNPKLTATSTGDLVSTGSGGFVPAGAVMPYAGSSAPTGWLLADGTAVSRTTHARLFAAIGTTHGVGDGSTTFNLPDLRGRSVAGRDDMGGGAANRLTSAGSGIDGSALGDAGGSQNQASLGTIGGTQSIAHTHYMDHAHGVLTINSAENIRALTSLDDTKTVINFANSSLITSKRSAGGSDDNDYLTTGDVDGEQMLYSTGALSPPSGGDGSFAKTSGIVTPNINNTVHGANFTFTGTASNVTQPTIVLNYIIKS